MLNIISLGAGVQSSTMALMAAHGEIIPMPDCAIFADTQWEPPAVYQWLDYLIKYLPFPVYRVTVGSLRQAAIDRAKPEGRRFAAIPWFMKIPSHKEIHVDDLGEYEVIIPEKIAMGQRQCTRDYKLDPIKKKIVELTGGRKPKSCLLWIGISTDESSRMKPSRVKYIENRWPLIEKSMTRNDCLRWIERQGHPKPPRSSCIGCPFHNDNEWRTIKADPVLWANAVEVDAAIRNQPGFRAEQFMHRSLVPLSEVDFSTDEDRGQLNMFENECEGMCGV